MAGRPPFKPTAAMRRKVSAAAAGGMSQDAIALALGITRPTLAKHFDLELTQGAAIRRMETLDSLFSQAKKGNVSAIRTVLLVQGAAGEPAKPAAGDAAQEGAAAGKGPRLGKKEAAQLAAQSAADGTDWDGLLPSTPPTVQ